MEIDILTNFNRWWTTGQVPKAFLGKHRRPLLAKLINYLDKRQILLVYGLRRVGKTTLFYQLIQHLLDQKIDSRQIFYFSFDEKRASLAKVIKTYQDKILKKELFGAGRVFLFLDEIQKVADWQNQIKIYYDQYPNLKIFLSGSASVLLQKKSQESLAGRLFDFHLKPLDLREFLAWRGIKPKNNLDLYQNQIVPLLLDYLRKGGFPEIVDEDDDELIKKYIRNTVLERIVYQDLPLEFGLKDTELLGILIEMIARQPGMIINFDRLARDLKRSKVTIINYFEYLRYALIIRELKNLKPGFLVSSRKGKKIYPTTAAFSFAYQEDFYREEFLPKVAEVVVVNHLEANHYFRNSFEVDVVLRKGKQIWPVEVKYGRVERESILKFLAKFKLEKGIIVSKDVFRKESNLKIIPLWRFLLENIK